MKNIKRIIAAFTLIFALGACQDYDTLVKNPNLPLTVRPNLLLTGILNSMNDDNSWSTTMWFNQFWISTYTYYGTNNYDQEPFIGGGFNYSTLENIVRMEQESIDAGGSAVNPYTALGKFLKAYNYYVMTSKFGDLPLSDALQGSDNIQPAYDSQKQIFLQILNWLDESNSELASLISDGDITLAGDIYLSNDLAAWQKVVNAFTLRVLISLENVSDDADLDVQGRFAAIIGDPDTYPIMGGIDDNLQYKYNAQFNLFPKNPGNRGFTVTREVVGSTFLELTTSLNDPRTFIAASPATAEIDGGKALTDFTAYVGGSAGEDMGVLGDNSQTGNYSYVNALRYYSTYDGSSAEPGIIIGYPEMCFNIAEGINRGWAVADAETWYVNGITASMEFFGISDGTAIPISDPELPLLVDTYVASVTDYLAQPSVVYQGDNADGLAQILNQKYIAFWQNSNWEAFFNARRTGIPAFKTGDGTGNSGTIPTRWQYPFAEQTANTSNYETAVQSQFGGTDDINGLLWLNKSN
jgi:hypothetical protein